MEESHASQLKLMYYYMNNTSCLKNLKEHDWAGFARKYNGPGYAENAYDQKLKTLTKTLKTRYNEGNLQQIHPFQGIQGNEPIRNCLCEKRC